MHGTSVLRTTHMSDIINETPTEQIIDNENTSTPNPEPVRDPEAVLRKNRELLEENARLKRERMGLENFDIEKAREALQQVQKMEEDGMRKRGEYEKLLEREKTARQQEIEAERQRRTLLESKLKEEKLAMALVESGVLPDRVGYLVKELSERVDLAIGDDGIALRTRGGIGDAAEFNALVEDVRHRSPFFFAANIVGGTGGSGSTGGNAVSSRSWNDLNGAEKAVAIREAGGDIELAKRKFK